MQKIFYNNNWISSSSKTKYSVSSFFYKKNFFYPECNAKDLTMATKSAIIGLKELKNINLKMRSKILYKISQEIKKNYKVIARLESEDTGKKILNSQNEILYAAKIWEFASQKLNIINPKKKKLTNKIKGEIFYEPVGCVALITPWNYPFIVISERLPFILGSGNSVIIKPSEYASRSITYLVKILSQQKLPIGSVNLLYGSGKNIGVQLVKNEKVKMISFTGSTETGKKIMSLGSKNIKRLSLELGGKNSIIVMKDADINKSVDIVIKSFCANSGQACVMTSKLLIDEKIKKIFINRLIQKLKLIKNFKSVLGPITTKFQFEKIHKLLLRNKKFNKNIIFGSIKKRKDNYLFPIIYDNIPINNEINKIEIFGPILSIISFTNVDEAIEIANSTNYGLSAVICCKNVNKARIISRKIECGRIWINNSIDISFPELPIGGFKESGFNRECGEEGFKTYSELKSVII